MTIKEIAELCGIKENTIRNWINDDDFLKSNFDLRNRIKEKLKCGSPENPSDYDLEETIAIIGEGGNNKTLASLLAENAANKNALVLKDTQGSTEWQKQVMAALATLMERPTMPLSPKEIKAGVKRLTEEREKELKEKGLMRLPWRRPVTQFICPFFGRSDVITELTELHDLLKMTECIKEGLHRFILEAKEIMQTDKQV